MSACAARPSSAESGSGRCTVGPSGDEATACTPRRSRQPTSTSSTCGAGCCSRRQPPEHRLAPRQRERDLGQLEARDLLDRGRPRASRRARATSARGSRPSARARSRSARGSRPARSAGTSSPSSSLVAFRPQPDHGRLRAGRPARPPRPVQRAPRQLDDQLRRERGRRAGEIRVDALLPAVRALGAQRSAARSCAGSRPARSSPPRAGRSSSAPRPRSPRRP